MARYLPPRYDYGSFVREQNPEDPSERWHEKGDLVLYVSVPTLESGGRFYHTFLDPSLDWYTRTEIVTYTNDFGTYNHSYTFSYIFIEQNGYYNTGIQITSPDWISVIGRQVGLSYHLKKIKAFEHVTMRADQTYCTFNRPDNISYYDTSIAIGAAMGQSATSWDLSTRPTIKQTDDWITGIGNFSGRNRLYTARGGFSGLDGDTGGSNPGPPFLNGDGYALPYGLLSNDPDPLMGIEYNNFPISYNPTTDEYTYYTGPDFDIHKWCGDAFWFRGQNIKGAGWKIGSI